MNSWRFRQFIVTLASDLHCGDRPLGFVARTLPFVPAHIPWYGLVSQIPGLCGWKNQFASYEKAIRLLDPALRFSPFFPLDADDTPLFPWGKGKNSIETFLLGSRNGVALHYNTRGARENHLFETETLLARSRTGKPTRLLGYCFWKPLDGELSINDDGCIGGRPLAELLRNSQWGGQRNQGMGAIGVVIEKNSEDTSFFHQMNGNGSFPQLKIKAGTQVPFYLRYQGSEEEVEGKLMPLAGRRHSERGPGLAMEPAVTVWDLGWRLQDTAVKETRVELSDRRYAVLEAHR